jgi:hypothetical protein
MPSSVARQHLSDRLGRLRKRGFLAHRSPLRSDDETSEQARTGGRGEDGPGYSRSHAAVKTADYWKGTCGGIPLIDWEAGKADKIRMVLLAEWKHIAERPRPAPRHPPKWAFALPHITRGADDQVVAPFVACRSLHLPTTYPSSAD